MAIHVPLRQGTPEWLAARRATVGSSDIPIIVGESTWKSAYTLGAEKLGLITEADDPDTAELRAIGHLMQPVLLSLYERKTGRHPKASHGWRVHPQIPWATASLDGTAPVRRAVEAKWTHAKKWRTEGPVPGDVLVQTQWQMFVTGWDVVDVVVLDYVQARVETVERDDEMIDNLRYFATEFHERLERGELPPLDGSDSTHRTLSARYPRDNGIWLPATDELAAAARDLAMARTAKKAAEDAERNIANALRAVIGDATGIEDLLSLRKNADSTRTNWPAVANAYRALLEEMQSREDLDAIQSIHSETAEGARVLRLLKGATE